jgi:hypothetical protein
MGSWAEVKTKAAKTIVAMKIELRIGMESPSGMN